jgi:hypothetical protein
MTNAIGELIAFSQEPGLFDGITAMEYAEYLYGAALVACQAYATAKVGDINKIRESQGLKPLRKLFVYRNGESESQQFHQIELINSLANLFKHKDEWSSWPVNETTKRLHHFGIDEKTEFPLHTGTKHITGNTDDLRVICAILEDWRAKQIQLFCKCKNR